MTIKLSTKVLGDEKVVFYFNADQFSGVGTALPDERERKGKMPV